MDVRYIYEEGELPCSRCQAPVEAIHDSMGAPVVIAVEAQGVICPNCLTGAEKLAHVIRLISEADDTYDSGLLERLKEIRGAFEVANQLLPS